jgi:hypothetical protein
MATTQSREPTPKAEAAGRARDASEEAAESAGGMRVSSITRLAMIQEAAYFRAQGRMFEPGHEVEDWLAAEREIDAILGDDGPSGLVERLQRERDELRVKMHLARLEVRQDWDELEGKWETFKSRYGGALKEAQSAGKDIGAAARSMLSEIRQGYRRIRKAL